MEAHSLMSIPYKIDGLHLYRTCPPEGQSRPALILIHEIWGLSDHIKDVADRFCKEGFEVIAPDLMAGTGAEKYARPELAAALFDPAKHPDKQADLRALYAPLRSPEFAEQTVEKLQACFAYLKKEDQSRKVGVIGFCFGGTYSFKLSTVEPNLAAAVPFYGHAEFSDEEAAKIKSPILAFYGDLDKPLMDELPELLDQMKNAGVNFSHKIYPGCKHAFFNDTNEATYSKEAAADAWQQTLTFLNQHLK